MLGGRRDVARSVFAACLAGLSGVAGLAPASVRAQTARASAGPDNLQNLSITELANLPVSSATKST